MKRIGLVLLPVIVLWLTAAARADVLVLDPGTAPNDATNIGNVDRGDAFDVFSNFSISSAGIFFDPLTNGATNITVNIYAVTPGVGTDPGTVGSLLGTASAPVTDAGFTFYDVPISFDFTSGNRYYMAFTANGADGWGFGLNNMRFFEFDSATNSPFTVGSVSVIDGGCFGTDCTGFGNFLLPELRLTTTSTSEVPEPSSAWLSMLLLSGIAFGIWRRKTAQSR
ncbi:MAG: PEP-CTERM sorting domain-containing protein [Acidobacteriia bacterium]|nr:PEP-CTERM sorting domain-containing protein [Terriglobia bacterium]